MSQDFDRWLESQLQPQPQPAPAAPTAPAPAVSAAPAAKDRWLPWILLGVLAAVLVWVIWSRDSLPGPGPGPGPSADVVETVLAAENTGAINRAKLNRKLAEMVLAGEIKDRHQFQQLSQKLTADARIDAWSAVDAMDQRVLPDPSFEGKEREVAAYLEQVAEGHERAAQ